MTQSAITPRAVEGERKNRDIAASKRAVASPTEGWIVQQEFEDDEAVNRETTGLDRPRGRSS